MKSCKKGYYYCFTDKKCKKIPKGWHLMSSGYIMRDKDHEDKEEEKKKNGNGHHSNGNGDGSGESNGGSNGGGDGGSGVAEGWSAKYKKSIDCNNPKGFSQRAHCQGRKKMNEAKNGDHEVAMAQSQLAKAEKNIAKLRKALGKKEKDIPAWMQAKITDTAHDTDAAAGYVDKISEARDGKSAKDKGYSLRDWFKGGGWVQAGGKYDGKPCAKQPGQKTKPFCRDADDRASMSKDERERRAKKKRREDPNPNRKGKAKMVTQEEFVNEKKDACYHKVKSRYSVWPSAYASGALVKCRKSGAKNWGNKTKKEGFSDWREDMLLEGLEDKLRKMSPEQIEDLIKANKGAEQKIRDAIKNMGTPKSQGPGAQLPNIPKQPASTSSATPRETYQRGGSDRVSYQRGGGSETYQRGGSDRVPYQRKPRPTKSPAPKPKVGAVRKVLKTLSKVKNPKVAAVLGLGALGAGMIYKMKKQQNEGYEFSNWRDDFKATEYESLNIVEPTPLKESEEIRYCPKCKKNEKKRECKYGEKYWTMFSVPASIGGGAYDPNEIHPANESVIQPGQLTTEDYQRLQSTGNVFSIMLMWRGKPYRLQLFFSGGQRPTREEVKNEIEKIYPGAILTHYYPSPSDPNQPIVVIQR